MAEQSLTDGSKQTRSPRSGMLPNPRQIRACGVAPVSKGNRLELGSASQRAFGADLALNVPNSTAQYPTVTVASQYGGGQTESGKVFVPPATESFTHDADGNLTQDGRWDLVWDGENRLVKLRSRLGSPAPERRIEFEYDHQGRRIRQRVFNDRDDGQDSELSDTIFLYDGWNVVAELNANASNAKVRTYVWGMGLSGTMQGAGGVGGLLKVTYYGGSTTNAFAAYDGNGNVMALVDASNGSVCARYEYGPFAEPIRVSGPMGKLNPVRFSSKYTDDESGFLYYGYRYYNPSTGRWPSRDPFSEAGSKNLVGFLNNDPLSHVDIMGFVPLVDVPWWPPPPPPKSAPTDPMRAAGYVPSPKRFKWEGVCPLTCCNEEQIKKGLNDLSEKYSAAVKAAAALGLRPASPYDPSNPASCKNSSLDIISWLMPTPPCWRCYLEHRDYNPSDVNDKWRDHQVIICISFGVLGNSKDQVMFDWWGDAKGRNNGGFTPHDPLPVREEYPYYAPTQPTSPDAYLDCQGMLHGRVPPKDFSASTARF